MPIYIVLFDSSCHCKDMLVCEVLSLSHILVGSSFCRNCCSFGRVCFRLLFLISGLTFGGIKGVFLVFKCDLIHQYLAFRII